MGPFDYGPRPAFVAGFQQEVLENQKEELYMGEIDNRGDRAGRGVLIDSFGNLYEGHFEKGKKSGHGRLIYTNGRYFEGGWKND